ncbi:MarR family winged helix-turn-helix transcriptional regulator [Nocardia sp. NPDC050793]|uniref:MarR family winged helix-turn-helix transcriptional regulator n=1 Tax=Nocardia sp. NPDC050793 TaxID=3155159 RepID=UPI0033CA6F1E
MPARRIPVRGRSRIRSPRRQARPARDASSPSPACEISTARSSVPPQSMPLFAYSFALFGPGHKAQRCSSPRRRVEKPGLCAPLPRRSAGRSPGRFPQIEAGRACIPGVGCTPSTLTRRGTAMTLTEARVMAALHKHGPLTMARLVEETGLRRPTVRPAVRTLAFNGLIEDRYDEWALSERGRAYAATPRGRNALDVPRGR